MTDLSCNVTTVGTLLLTIVNNKLQKIKDTLVISVELIIVTMILKLITDCNIFYLLLLQHKYKEIPTFATESDETPINMEYNVQVE